MGTYGWEIQLCAGLTPEALDRTLATAQQLQDYLPLQDLKTVAEAKNTAGPSTKQSAHLR